MYRCKGVPYLRVSQQILGALVLAQGGGRGFGGVQQGGAAPLVISVPHQDVQVLCSGERNRGSQTSIVYPKTQLNTAKTAKTQLYTAIQVK